MTLLAQIAAEHPALYTYGPMGVMLGWFMWRAEKLGNAVVSELRGLRHGQNGLQKALLVVEANRHAQETDAQLIAKRMIAEIEAKENLS